MDSNPAETTDLDQLVDHWLTFEQAADTLGVTRNKVRQLASEGQLIALRTTGSRVPRVPARCLSGDQIVSGLPGTLTLLADSGFSEEEAARWMFTADDSLPGRPIDALHENRPAEVRRRAQALAL